MKPKKLIFIIIGVVVVAAILCAASGQIGKLAQANLPQVTPTAESTVEASVRARGEVKPGMWAELAFNTSGRLVAWEVAEGATVAPGQVLGRLDSAQAELALKQAQGDLAAAQSRLTQAETNLTYQIQEAELALQQAEARLAQSKARYPSAAQAEVTLARAEKALVDANEAYRQNSEYPGMFDFPGVRDHYQEKIDLAQQDLTVARAAYASARGEQTATGRELDVLEGEVTRAQLALEKAKQGVDPALALDVAQAQLRVEKAQADHAALTLIAPFGGTIVALNLKAEDWAQAGVAALTLADLSSLRVETTDLDEWGMTHIAVGDPARITFTAFDDKTLDGQVSAIALRGEPLPGGDIAYRVVITLDQPDPDLRWGMTVRVTIPLGE